MDIYALCSISASDCRGPLATDILAGSIPITLLCFAWIFYTPIKNQVIGFLQRGVIFIVRRLKSKTACSVKQILFPLQLAASL